MAFLPPDGPPYRELSRRQLLHGFGAAAGALAIGSLAACSKSSSRAAPSRLPSSSPGSSLSSASPSLVAPSSVTVPTPTVIHDVTTLGAIGDGVTDDTAALAAALKGLQTGQALRLPAGKTFNHSDVLVLATPGAQLLGPGTLRATREGRSALKIDAADVVLDGVQLAITSTTQRWQTPNQHKVFLGPHAGIVIRNVTITGSAAAGLFSFGASNFVFERVSVSDTRADGIHMTNGSSNGSVVLPVIARSGDDGVAVVSYFNDPQVCHDINVISPKVHTTTGGRGISVVGGQNITYTDIEIAGSYAAAVYVACEGGTPGTAATKTVRVTGGSITGANTSTRIDHGAVLVYSGRSAGEVSDVIISGLTIADTRASASRQVGVVADSGDPVSAITFKDLTLQATPTAYQGNAPSSAVTLDAVTAAGKAVSVSG